MKKMTITISCILAGFLSTFGQAEYKVITAVESIIPMGLGRSRLLEPLSELDYKDYTTERTDGKSGGQGKVKRGDIKIDGMAETKLLNFYSGVGINMRNIASNDAVMTSKLNDMAAQGWDLFQVTSGVESNSGKQDGEGIFITRYIFKRTK